MHDQATDQQKLHDAFWASFDTSKCQHYLDKLTRPGTGERAPEILGAGADFTAYKLAGREPLVLKIANQQFSRKMSGESGQRWVQRINDLGRDPAILVPPMQAFIYGDVLATCMPLGSTDGPRGISDEEKQMFLATLRARNLLLNDLLQIRWWGEIPFVCDFSDLQHAALGY